MTKRSLWCSIWLLLISSHAFPQAPTRDWPSGLPCSDSSPGCLKQLGDLAAAHSPELQILDRALAYQRRKTWTSWLNADGLNPLAVGLRVARNLAGGGDMAAARLEIARLEARRAEVEAGLRLAVAQGVAEVQAAARRLELARARLEAHRTQVEIISFGYRLGQGSTEEMIKLWQAGEELRGQITEAESDLARASTRLRAKVQGATS